MNLSDDSRFCQGSNVDTAPLDWEIRDTVGCKSYMWSKREAMATTSLEALIESECGFAGKGIVVCLLSGESRVCI